MDSKRSNREFIMKQDYQSELEEMLGSKLARLEEGTSAFKNNLESLVNSRLSESEERAVSFSQESEVRIKKLQEYIDQQEERRNGLESSFKQHQSSSSKLNN